MTENVYEIQPDWPETYKGLKVKYLMQILEEINTPGGTNADKKDILIMDDFLREYQYGVYANQPSKNEIVL